MADKEIGPGKEFSLEMIANSLGINRRRIYDIINVMEALEMISKQSKNWYLWHGQSNLVATLAKLKVSERKGGREGGREGEGYITCNLIFYIMYMTICNCITVAPVLLDTLG